MLCKIPIKYWLTAVASSFLKESPHNHTLWLSGTLVMIASAKTFCPKKKKKKKSGTAFSSFCKNSYTLNTLYIFLWWSSKRFLQKEDKNPLPWKRWGYKIGFHYQGFGEDASKEIIAVDILSSEKMKKTWGCCIPSQSFVFPIEDPIESTEVLFLWWQNLQKLMPILSMLLNNFRCHGFRLFLGPLLIFIEKAISYESYLCPWTWIMDLKKRWPNKKTELLSRIIMIQ